MIKVELKVEGENGSGKSRILKEIKEHLELKGLDIKLISEDEHKLIISGDLE